MNISVTPHPPTPLPIHAFNLLQRKLGGFLLKPMMPMKLVLAPSSLSNPPTPTPTTITPLPVMPQLTATRAGSACRGRWRRRSRCLPAPSPLPHHPSSHHASTYCNESWERLPRPMTPKKPVLARSSPSWCSRATRRCTVLMHSGSDAP